VSPEGALSVPGNILLLGEYAVVDPGGLGVALAVEPRVAVTWAPADGLQVTGRGAGEPVSWPGPGAELFDAVIQTTDATRIGSAVQVDSSAFYRAGRKLGYGSSAAVAVGLTAALLALIHRERPPLDRVFQTALKAHRRFQDGRGSGYDVAASTYGGVGLFTGGVEPVWSRLQLDWLPQIGLFSGHEPVATSGAVGRYRDWQAGRPDEARRRWERSNALVRRFVQADSWRSGRRVFKIYRQYGIALGKIIGVNARIRPPFKGNRWYKAVGAGDELGVVLGRAEGVRSVRITQGLRWL
jgi:phosphomevalonate kinase